MLGPRSLPRWSTRPGHRADDDEVEIFPRPRRGGRTGADAGADDSGDDVPHRRARRLSARRPKPAGEPDALAAADAAPAGVLFDVDGTLVDTTYLHTVAWWEAMRQVDRSVPMARIHRAVGMGSDTILDHLLGADRDRSDDDTMVAAHGALYATYWDRLSPLPGAVELLRACAARGLRVALASSASGRELAALRAALGADDVIAAATSADDADRSKPAPDLIAAALRKTGLDATRAVYVGDSVWDVIAASQLDLPCVALTSGGTSAAELTEAGAAAVYADPADLLAALDRSPIGKLG
ncbi:MAG TPA: HAD family hydrolase [Pilimelia sp.]|nr:HAD family hydrolase [Pilimelia sp.]